MAKHSTPLHRRRFLTSAATASAAIALPHIIPSSAIGRDGATPPSERVVVGGIGIGRRGSYVLGCFLDQRDVQFAAVCDVKQKRRQAVKQVVDEKYGNGNCAMIRDFRELLDRRDIDAVMIATGPNWHGTASMYAARAGKDIYCEKPCTKNISQSLALADTIRRTGRVFQVGTQRRNIPHFALACELARTGKLGKLQAVHAHPRDMLAMTSGWLPAEVEPSKEVVDWDMYLGPAAWRPYNQKLLIGSNFEKGGGLVGAGVLEWGTHCVDLCQWALGDCPAPVEYYPLSDERLTARYANGVELVIRRDGWLPLGSCPVRFEGEAGWVEAGDSGKIVVSSPALLAGRNAPEIDAAPATAHVRDFLDCVKSRGRPRADAEAACQAHIACQAANIALFLGRKLTYDHKTNAFVGDEVANRLRSEAARGPWRA
ncbi:MAG TPA: Gfo/Idh/MocA family oxidoreductase [Pirellulales bacterium]|nr:Gfo/Idh/MocA family oxidoreductase [Pirellulales bacterium]